nr:MAG TPA: Putative transferase, nesg, ydcK, Structural Genomics.38A [Caudoviricetes sp.]
MNKKFELLPDDTITIFGIKLFRIKALISFGNVEEGELGGYIEKEDNLSVYGNAEVYGNARVYGNAWVSGDARVYGNADYIVFKNHWSSGRYFTYTKSNKMWRVGCFYGTGQELINKAYQDSEISGKHYEAYVEFVEKLEKLEETND